MEREASVYKECMRNHAANLGTYATDGCGEYTPDPNFPSGLRCAACGCHRNFHRRMEAGEGIGHQLSPSPTSEERSPKGCKRRPRTKFTAEQKEEMLKFAEKIGWRIPRKDAVSGGKDEVARFCMEIGVSRQIFKVWMHNHKSSSSSRVAGGGIGNNGDGIGRIGDSDSM